MPRGKVVSHRHTDNTQRLVLNGGVCVCVCFLSLTLIQAAKNRSCGLMMAGVDFSAILGPDKRGHSIGRRKKKSGFKP